MGRVSERELPGVGARFDLATSDGDQLGVVVHRSGRRDLAVYDEADPDACRAVVRLEEAEARDLAELLGGSRISEAVAKLRHDVAGLTLEWVEVLDGAPWAGRSIGEVEVRTETGVSIVALVHDGDARPSPGPDDRFEVGTTVIAMGMAEGLEQLAERLSG
ncbi:MAG: cation:proton antiporter regulatory subunit [Microthrixaceae bacterium]